MKFHRQNLEDEKPRAPSGGDASKVEPVPPAITAQSAMPSTRIRVEPIESSARTTPPKPTLSQESQEKQASDADKTKPPRPGR